MENKKTEIGIVGLGVMGRNLSLNVADHGFSVAGYDKDSTKVEALLEQKQEGTVHAAEEVRRFIELLRTPRAILILVPAGAAVDSVIDDLLPHLKQGDVLIDGGNSHYTDTERRMDRLQSQGIHFLGMGIS
ncbi:MAG: NAD(P)-binding domain-containing protein, partial [Anaerolineales bacterium]